jgi:hypothetical protein
MKRTDINENTEQMIRKSLKISDLDTSRGIFKGDLLKG